MMMQLSRMINNNVGVEQKLNTTQQVLQTRF